MGGHFLRRDEFIVMLGECPDDKPAFEVNNHACFAYVVVKSIDDLYQEYQKREIEILSDLENKQWGHLEFAIRTIDGHRIMFGEEIIQ